MQAVVAAAVICIVMQILHFLHPSAEVPDKAPGAIERLVATFGGAQTQRAESIRTAGSFVQSGLPLEEVYAVAAAVRAHYARKSLHGGRSPVPACQCLSWFSWLALARCNSRWIVVTLHSLPYRRQSI